MPKALERKYPNAAAEWGWQYVFPSVRRPKVREAETSSGPAAPLPPCRRRSSVRWRKQASPSPPVVTPCGIRLRLTSWNRGRTSVPRKSFSATRICLPHRSTRTFFKTEKPGRGVLCTASNKPRSGGADSQRGYSNPNPLDLFLRHLLLAVVVDAGRVCGGMPRNALSGLQVAPVFEERCDASCPKRMAGDGVLSGYVGNFNIVDANRPYVALKAVLPL